jgi:hypothetical protein
LEERKAQNRKEFQKNKQLVKDIEQRARQRPLLVESIHQKKHASNLAKIKATHQYIEILKESNLDPNQHLTDEQKELLAEEEYIERRKKELKGH